MKRRQWSVMLVLALAAAVPQAAAARKPPDRPAVRNPFDLQRLTREQAAATRQERLLHFALGQLRMVGSLVSSRRRVALVMDPQNHIHLLEAGQRIGPDQSRIIHIEDQAIVLQETALHGQGQRVVRTVRLEMEPP